jgi:hypothetical protein
MSQKKLLNDLQLTKEELISYVQDKIGYAWHINKLTIFEEPRELKEYVKWNNDTKWTPDMNWIPLTKAPQRLTWVYEEERE